jgi:hypothetical protein
MDEVVTAAGASPSPWSLLQGLLALLVVWGAYRAGERCWLRPRRLDRALRAQGLSGTEYCFPAGDLKENARLNEEARARPMPQCHDILPRIMPHLLDTVKEHGTFLKKKKEKKEHGTSRVSHYLLVCSHPSVVQKPVLA